LGDLLTEPLPVIFTVRVYWVGGIWVNVAVTELLAFMVMDWGLVMPIRSPLQPLNTQPGSAVAVSCTEVPES
jgi:hypothetical protein